MQFLFANIFKMLEAKKCIMYSKTCIKGPTPDNIRKTCMNLIYRFVLIEFEAKRTLKQWSKGASDINMYVEVLLSLNLDKTLKPNQKVLFLELIETPKMASIIF